jgi:hypothetical protein
MMEMNKGQLEIRYRRLAGDDFNANDIFQQSMHVT